MGFFSKCRSVRRHHHRLTYATVYNRAYQFTKPPWTHLTSDGSPLALNAWIRTQLHNIQTGTFTLHARSQLTTHIVTMQQTQWIGRKFDKRTTQLLQETFRINTFAITFRLRRLQQRILKHLWRPDGILMLRNVPWECMFTSTPAVEK